MDSIAKFSKLFLLAAFLIAALGTSVFLYKSAMNPDAPTALFQKK